MNDDTHSLPVSVAQIPDINDVCNLICQTIPHFSTLSTKTRNDSANNCLNSPETNMSQLKSDTKDNKITAVAQKKPRENSKRDKNSFSKSVGLCKLFNYETSDWEKFRWCRDQENQLMVNVFMQKGEMLDDPNNKNQQKLVKSSPNLLVSEQLISKTHSNKSVNQWFDCETSDLENSKWCRDQESNTTPGKITAGNRVKSIYRCKVCEFCSYSLFLFTLHLHSHESLVEYSADKTKNLKKYNCKRYDLRSRAIPNPFQETNKKLTQCYRWRCYKRKRKDNTSRRQVVITRHTKKLSVKWYKCDYCAYKSKSKSHVTRHSARLHIELDIKWRKCYYCDYIAKAKTNLTSHLLNHHAAAEEFKCGYCEYKAIKRTILKCHLFYAHKQEYVRWHKCCHCKYKFNDIVELNKHLLSKHAMKNDIRYLLNVLNVPNITQRGNI